MRAKPSNAKGREYWLCHYYRPRLSQQLSKKGKV